jgi:hypothetical protein
VRHPARPNFHIRPPQEPGAASAGGGPATTVEARRAPLSQTRAARKTCEGHFAVLPGHQIPEIETLVKENGHYAIVHNNVS